MRNKEHKKEYDKKYHALNKGRWSKSKEYQKENVRKYRERNKERVIKEAKEKYIENKEEIIARQKARRNKDWKIQQARLRIEKLEAIAGRNKPETCEVCGSAGKIVFDHNHSTGKFRGWICNYCNVALGQVKDNVKVLGKLIDYLNKNNVTGESLLSPITVNELIINKYRVRTPQ